MRILLLRHGGYSDDPRVTKEVHSLIDEGFKVDIICLKQGNHPFREVEHNLTIFHLPKPCPYTY